MSESVEVFVNGQRVLVPEGATVAVALMIAQQACRVSVRGENRGPLCGMGICFECRASVDGISQRRTCQLLCQPQMKVETIG